MSSVVTLFFTTCCLYRRSCSSSSELATALLQRHKLLHRRDRCARGLPLLSQQGLTPCYTHTYVRNTHTNAHHIRTHRHAHICMNTYTWMHVHALFPPSTSQGDSSALSIVDQETEQFQLIQSLFSNFESLPFYNEYALVIKSVNVLYTLIPVVPPPAVRQTLNQVGIHQRSGEQTLAMQQW